MVIREPIWGHWWVGEPDGMRMEDTGNFSYEEWG
jgi:hypothetical protein